MVNTSLDNLKNHFQHTLTHYLSAALINAPARLADAINYAALQNGKRLRPLLVYTAGLTLGCDLSLLDAPACAIELIHIFSLIHDDLPGMDNDDWRRGQPTCHKKFDEATAILAGDALLILANTILCNTNNNNLTAQQLLVSLQTLNAATGPVGMIGGQMLDMQLASTTTTSTVSVSVTELEKIYLLKTGALFRASVKLGAIAANCQQEIIFQALDSYARCLGLAFQIKDDVADKDSADNKLNYITATNLSTAQQTIQNLYQQAITSLQIIPHNTFLLKNLAAHIL